MPANTMKSTRSPNTKMEQLRQERREVYGSREVSHGAQGIDPGLIQSNYFFLSNALSQIQIIYIFIAIRCQRSVHRDRVMGVCNKMFKLGMRCCLLIQFKCKETILTDVDSCLGFRLGGLSMLIFPFQTSLPAVIPIMSPLKSPRKKPEQEFNLSQGTGKVALTPYSIKCRR